MHPTHPLPTGLVGHNRLEYGLRCVCVCVTVELPPLSTRQKSDSKMQHISVTVNLNRTVLTTKHLATVPKDFQPINDDMSTRRQARPRPSLRYYVTYNPGGRGPLSAGKYGAVLINCSQTRRPPAFTE